MKSRFSFPLVIALATAALVAGCGKSTSPTSVTTPTDSTAPAAPTSVSSTFDAATSLAYLTWQPSSSASVDGYEVWVYQPDPSRTNSYVLAGTVASPQTSWQLPVVGYTQTRWYQVRAFNGGGNNSSWTTPLQVTLSPAPTGGTGGSPLPGTRQGDGSF
ncbi:MAG TPA: hypothetical protein VFI79_09725 [Gemmatimonadales bacterium]|nr:hypothetical protein [Gemmatimonadales bacterium]